MAAGREVGEGIDRLQWAVRGLGLSGDERVLIVPFEASIGAFADSLAADADAYVRGRFLLYQWGGDLPLFRVVYAEPALFGSKQRARLIYEVDEEESADSIDSPQSAKVEQ